MRGIVYHKIENYSQAISDYTKAIKINPQYSLVYLNRGIAYYCIKSFFQACSDWQKAHQLGLKEALDFINECCK